MKIVKDDAARKALLKELDNSARQGRKANLSELAENTLYVPEGKNHIVAVIESSFFGWLFGMK